MKTHLKINENINKYTNCVEIYTLNIKVHNYINIM